MPNIEQIIIFGFNPKKSLFKCCRNFCVTLVGECVCVYVGCLGGGLGWMIQIVTLNSSVSAQSHLVSGLFFTL